MMELEEILQKELTKLKAENDELNSSLDDYEEANKRLSKQADDMYKLCQKESDKYYILSQKNTQLKEKLKEVEDCLRDLLEMQNGAPLIRFEKEFNEIETKCWKLLTNK